MFIIKPINNQKCVIAKQDIKKDTILFFEQIKFYVDKNKKDWYEQLLLYELEHNYNLFIDLAPHQNDKYIIKDGIFEKKYDITFDKNLFYNKIIRNAFNIKIDGKNCATVLYKGRLFNHSCIPNIKFKFDGTKMIFYTCCDIKKGDELLDNYFDINLPYDKRQYISKTFYGFECKCKKCLIKK